MEIAKLNPGVAKAFVVIAGIALSAAIASCAPSHARETGKEPSTFSISMGDLEWISWESPLKVPGAKLAVLKGAFDKPGELVFLGYQPAHFQIPAHWHDTDEDIEVVAGSIYMGVGDDRPVEPANGMLFRNGDKHLNPAKTVHWLVTTNEPAIIKILTSGPFGTHWVEKK